MTKHDRRPSQEDIARCLAKELKVQVTPESHSELIEKITAHFVPYLIGLESYESLDEAIDNTLNAVGNAIISDYGQALSLSNLRGRSPNKEEVDISPDGLMKIERKKMKVVHELHRRLSKVRRDVREMLKLTSAKILLTLILWDLIKRSFPEVKIFVRIDRAVLRLLQLYGIEEQKRTPDMIRRRIERYQDPAKFDKLAMRLWGGVTSPEG